MIEGGTLERLKEITLSCLKAHNLELIEISCHGAKRPLLAILIDRPEGGITIDECALMNRLISEAFDSADVSNSGYMLEVSSPGIDRPLKVKNDFYHVINKKVRCFLAEPIKAKREIEGLVKEVREELVILDTDDGEMEIAFNNLAKAKQIAD